MIYLDREAAKDIVRQALSEVADFNGEFEDYPFQPFHPFHRSVFLSSLKKLINAIICTDENGNIVEDEFFDLNLSVTEFKNWNKIVDCIEHITNNHFREVSSTKKIEYP